MTDARVSQAQVQVLNAPVPAARVSEAMVQVLSRSGVAPTRPFVRTVSSASPVKIKQSDGSWWPVQAVE